MELVLSTFHFSDIGGSETYLLTVAEQLERLGHGVTIHAAEVGEMAEVAARRGVRVADDEDRLPQSCDAVIVQDAPTALELADRYPSVPQVFVVHSDAFDPMTPPQLPGVTGAVVAMNDRVAGRVRASAAGYEPVRLRQPIDVTRFRPLGDIGERPRRALLLGNYLRGARRDMLVEALEDAGIECSQVGAHSAASPEPEGAIADADIVIGFGRSILEAMACGRAAYVFDHLGGDGWVTRDRYPTLEADGFGGRAEGGVVDRERLARDVSGYSAEMGLANHDLVRSNHDAGRHVQQLVGLIRQLPAPTEQPTAPLREMARLVRLQWRAERRAATAAGQSEVLRGRIEALERELRQVKARVAHAEARAAEAEVERRDAVEELEYTLGTTRLKLLQALMLPIDVIRDRPHPMRRKGTRRLRRAQAKGRG